MRRKKESHSFREPEWQKAEKIKVLNLAVSILALVVAILALVH